VNNLDLTGQKFGRLTVLEKSKTINKRATWLCKCDCGNTKIIKAKYLRNGDTKSCGCLNKEKCIKMYKKAAIKNRKYHPTISAALVIWRDVYREMNFEDFYNLSQQNCYYCCRPPSNIINCEYPQEYTEEKKPLIYNGLDRIDNSKPHSKENCVPCCKQCNYAKRERSIEDFGKWLIRLYNKFGSSELE
jgi:hypothetical protein